MTEEKTSDLKRTIIVSIVTSMAVLMLCWIILVFSSSMEMARKDGKKDSLSRALSTLVQSTHFIRDMGPEYSCKSAKTKDLTRCIAKTLMIKTKTNNTITLGDDTTMFISSDNDCTIQNSCFVILDINGTKGPNEEYEDQLSVPIIYFENDKTIGIYQDDYDNLVYNLNARRINKRNYR